MKNTASVIACLFICLALLGMSSCASAPKAPAVVGIPNGSIVGIGPYPKSETGEVTIVASEPGASILVNGELVGTGKATIIPTTPRLDIIARHPEYYDLSLNASPTLKISDSTELSRAGMIVGLGGMMVGLIMEMVAVIPSSKPKPYNANEPSVMEKLTPSLCVIGGGAALALISMPKTRNAYYSTISLDMSRSSRYDSAGYSKDDGFDRYGFKRDGSDAAGNRFSGKVVRGMKEGSGAYASVSGEVFSGYFANDALEGPGTWKQKDSTIVRGIWKRGKLEGTAVAIRAGGEAQIQSWRAGELVQARPPAGKILSSRFSWIYLGTSAVENLADGRGDAVDARSGARLAEALFVKGRLTEGTLTYPDGGSCKGSFADDQLVKGSVVAADGTRYTGDLKGGLYEGNGIIVIPNGEKYEGTFRSGKPNGIGMITLADGTVERCEYYDGKRVDQVYLMRVERQRLADQMAAVQAQAQEQAEAQARADEDRRRAEERARIRAEADAAPVKVTQNQWAVDALKGLDLASQAFDDSPQAAAGRGYATAPGLGLDSPSKSSRASDSSASATAKKKYLPKTLAFGAGNSSSEFTADIAETGALGKYFLRDQRDGKDGWFILDAGGKGQIWYPLVGAANELSKQNKPDNIFIMDWGVLLDKQGQPAMDGGAMVLVILVSGEKGKDILPENLRLSKNGDAWAAGGWIKR